MTPYVIIKVIKTTNILINSQVQIDESYNKNEDLNEKI